MYNPKLFWGAYVFIGVLIASCFIVVSHIRTTVYPEDCVHGVISCMEAKKHWYDSKIEYRECDKVYCRKSPLVEEKRNNIHYDVQVIEPNEILEP